MQADSLTGVQQILNAAVFAAHKHSTQRRKGDAAEPYVNHVLEVAQILAGSLEAPDTNLIIAALLHDVVEDSGVHPSELTERFGHDVMELVMEVTDDKTLPKSERKRLQVLNAPKKSARAQQIKIADKISNLRAIITSPPADWSLERRREYFTWAQAVVSGLAAADPALRVEFDDTVKRFQEALNGASSD